MIVIEDKNLERSIREIAHELLVRQNIPPKRLRRWGKLMCDALDNNSIYYVPDTDDRYWD